MTIDQMQVQAVEIMGILSLSGSVMLDDDRYSEDPVRHFSLEIDRRTGEEDTAFLSRALFVLSQGNVWWHLA